MHLRDANRLGSWLTVVVCLGVVVALTGCEGVPGAKGPAVKAEPSGSASLPKGAIILFGGTDTSGWTRVSSRGRPIRWTVEDGVLVCKPRTGSIQTRQTFGDCKLHLEFKVPHMPKAEKGSQARGNSGVFLQGRYEIQILDSYEIGRPIQDNDCGGLYKLITPSKNACKPAGEWQTYDIAFRAPKFDKGGKMTQKGRITVVQNGIAIIDNKEINGTTAGGVDDDPKTPGLQYDLTKPGPLMLQDHGNRVAFRNVWLVPLE